MMASLSSNQVRNCCYSSPSNTHRGFSTAQASLQKILRTISTVQPPPNCEVRTDNQSLISNRGVDDGLLRESNAALFGEKQGLDIDLNLSLFNPFGESGGGNRSESSAENGDLSACSFVGKTRIIESDLSVNGGKRGREGIEEKMTECYCSSDITNFQQVQSVQDENEIIDGNGESKIQKDKDEEEHEENTKALREERLETAPFPPTKKDNDCYLSLLIAAAELISSTESPSQGEKLTREDDDEEKKTKTKLKPKPKTQTDTINTESEWTADVDDTSSPVVGSKRGRRSHVLPQRYRDSVLLLEPWKKPKRSRRSRR